MKKNLIFGALSAAALLFAGACSNDVIEPGSENGGNAVNPEDGVYLAVNFDLPSAKGTRSYTDGENSSNGGTEVGQDFENTVRTTYIVLAKTDNSFIAAAANTTLTEMGTSGRSYRSSAKFTKTELNDYYQKLNFDIDEKTGNHKINVFVFCNPTDGLKTVLDNTQLGDTNWMNALGVWDENNNNGTSPIWASNNFLMGNNSICTRLFPGSLDAWDDFSTEASAFNLSGMNNFGRPNEIDNYLEGKGNVEVERAAARYDFRDGAPDPENAPQTYPVLLDSEENPLVNVKLGRMSMVNMNKEFYFLRRVSNDGLDKNYTICGPELPWYNSPSGTDIPGQDGNYVVDAFSEWKYSGQAEFNKGGYALHFNYPFFNEDGEQDNLDATANDRWYTSLISDVINGSQNDQTGNYKVWRYLTEGTIPGVTSQKNAVSNGIVFKGLLQPARTAADTDDDFTKKLLEVLQVRPGANGNNMEDPILFLFGGHLYSTWDHIRRAAISFAITDIKHGADGAWTFSVNRSSTLYNAVFGNGGFGTVTFEETAEGKINFLTTKPAETPGVVTITDPTPEDETSPDYLYSQWKATPVLDEQFYDFRDAAVAKNIALYMTSYDEALGGWGYYCYYYYWNRHNDNGQTGVMGPMEFAVVRNNVYKLAVTKLSRIGHPRIPENDPDKPTPNTPDEKGDVYITVTCTTLPWVVRENNIEF
ncbi:MAG: Mfa1 family fimbria major subunit [Muribaculaceae bacterium]|nr:Mfa1 family fimbria major subunit [Muribaculaceae bacterium]